jgi:DNA-directed RNA polymerase subunit M/transcription elongation factor TFIIS
MASDDKKYPGLSGGDWYPKFRDASFECPICGSNGFHRLQVPGRNGKKVDTESWECSRCSVVFRSWRQFTKSR